MAIRKVWAAAAAGCLSACASLPATEPPEHPQPAWIFPVRLPRCRAGVCTRELVPLLARVEQIPGVDRTLINRQGTLLLLLPSPEGVPREICRKISDIFPATRPFSRPETDRALASQSWGSPGCGLTEWLQIENDPGPWVTAFCLLQGYNASTAGRLGALASEEWLRVRSEGADRHRPAQVARLADRLAGRCADVLSVNQREQLRRSILKWPAFTLARHLRL